MPSELTHASFFSGVGGLDLGLERAGWRTVSFSEIDPYANAVLAERWPGVPNLGNIVEIAGDGWSMGSGQPGREWTDANLWSGGFPCQDLSVAGKRRGFGINSGQSKQGVELSAAGSQPDSGPSANTAYATRSSLAFAFLALVERHRPPAVLLENVPGLLSSHAGRDFGTLLSTLGELGYGWAYRILDARYFGVPQRRRRVFIVALDTERGLGADRAAEVLSVGARCDRHPAAGIAAGPNAADGIGAGISRALSTSQERIDADTESFVVSPPPDADRVRAADGLAGRLDGGNELAGPLVSVTGKGGHRTTDLNTPLAFVKRARVSTPGSPESWEEGGVMPTLNSFDVGDTRTTAAIIGGAAQDDPLLPIGLDSHRYRCCGNGVVAPVAEFIGERLAEVFS